MNKLLTICIVVLFVANTAVEAEQGSIVWDPDRIRTILGSEEPEVISTTFISVVELHDVELYVVPELRRFVRVEPSSFVFIEPDTPYNVTVYLSVPHGTYPGLYEGTIHLRESRRTVPNNLKISLEVFYENVSIPPTTKTLTEYTTQFLLSVSPDSSILTFSELSPELDSLKRGDIIVISVTPHTPYGLLRRVLRVSKGGGEIRVETCPSSIEEAIEQATITLSHTLTPADLADGLGYFQTERIELVESQEGFYLQIDNVVLYDNDGDLSTTEDQITAEGYISLNPSFDFSATIENFQLTQLVFTNTSTETIHIEVSSDIELLSVEEKAEICRYFFTPIVIWVGSVPVVFTPVLTVNVGIDGEVSVGIETNLTQEAMVVLGLGYDYGNWYPISNFSNEFDFDPPILTAECNFKGYAGPQLNLLIYGIIGPYAELRGYLELDADIMRVPWCKMYGGIEAGAGVRAEVLCQEVTDYSFPALIGYRLLIWSSGIGAEGYISGNVKDAITRAGLQNVIVEVYDGSSLVSASTTDASGDYNVSAPVGEDYRVLFTKTGYLPATYRNVSVLEDATTYLEVVLQIDSEYSGLGNVSGRILNALDGSGVSGLALSLREGINTREGSVIRTTTTEANGNYSLMDLNAGQYTAEVSGTGYNTTYFTIVCIGGTTTFDQNATVTPILPPGETRIVLTWGENPSDLDSHLTGPLTDGSRFHMYYPYAEENSGSPWPTYVKLDRDDVTSYGPETTTIYIQIDGTYRFTVHDYTNRWSTNSTALSNSFATVQVYRGSQLVATYYVPSVEEGTAWTVFEMNGDTITPINIMYYTSSPSGIQSLQVEDADLFRELPPKESTETGDNSVVPEKVVADPEEAVGFTLFEAAETINALDPDNFNNEDSATALTNEIYFVLSIINDGLYAEAQYVLENDILERTNGCANIGKPDENDWITTPEGQGLVYPLIVEAIELLESLI